MNSRTRDIHDKGCANNASNGAANLSLFDYFSIFMLSISYSSLKKMRRKEKTQQLNLESAKFVRKIQDLSLTP